MFAEKNILFPPAESKNSKASLQQKLAKINESLTSETAIEKRDVILLEAMRDILDVYGFTFVTVYEPGEANNFEEDLRHEFQDSKDYKEWDEDILWRGDIPRILLDTIVEEKPIKLSSKHFNVAGNHKVSISYTGGLREEENQDAFNMCIGFVPDHGQLDNSLQKEVSLKGVYDIQKDMFHFGGSIEPEDIQHVMVRSHGTGPGKVGRTYLFTKKKLTPAAQEKAA